MSLDPSPDPGFFCNYPFEYGTINKTETQAPVRSSGVYPDFLEPRDTCPLPGSSQPHPHMHQRRLGFLMQDKPVVSRGV